MNANIKTVQDTYEAFGRGDIPFILSCCTDDVDWQGSDSPEIPYSGKYRGKAGATQFFQRIADAFDVKAFQPKSFVASGNEVMTTGSWTCTAKSTGKTFTAEWAMRFVFDRDGKATMFRSYDDTAFVTTALR